ncbi:MAG: hypothetical protein R2794_09295 [Chitinophagales bacterium]
MENPFQLSFIQRLKDSRPPGIQLAEELSEVLQLSMDSVYRRMRGETAMSIDEAIRICNHYKIPIAHFTEEIPGLVNFKYQVTDNTRNAFSKHIHMLLEHSDNMLQYADRKIYYAAIDAPLFLQFGLPALAAFKLHYWMYTILGVAGAGSYYNQQDIDRELITLAGKIYDTYLEIPSYEVWPSNILDTTLKQLQFYWDSGYFKKAGDCLEILQDLHILMQTTRMMTERNHKLAYGDKTAARYADFHLYQSDTLLGNNTVVTHADEKDAVFISHMTFNVMFSSNAIYAAETMHWMQRLIGRSTLISGTGEKNRMLLFRELEAGISKMEKQLRA